MTGPTPDTITVNGHRLWQSLMDLAEIGAYDDERTGLRGVNRLALTDADAGLAAARIGVHLRAMVDSGAYGELRATVGHLAVHPDLTNIVPARAELTVDLRNPDDARMARAEEDLAAFLRTLEDGTPGLTLTTRRMAKTAYVPFDERVHSATTPASTPPPKRAPTVSTSSPPPCSGWPHKARPDGRAGQVSIAAKRRAKR
ncbi:hypothetical protein ACEYXF_33820 [Streptomyces asiaticus]|uniref:hypothetical protein n=1 Tax=Streptomyces asiaticus TaxID=114695 RepID=UPI0039BDEC48